jgi:hypothetical protein
MNTTLRSAIAALLGTALVALAMLVAGCGVTSPEATAASPPVAAELEPAPAVAAGAHDADAAHAQEAAAKDCPHGGGAEPAVTAAGTGNPAAATAPPAPPSELAFTGTREETERLIRHYQTIQLTPEQERVKVAALATIPAPCCDDNPLATCCCPCNMAKAAWGMAAWLITERQYGVEQVRQAALDWLAAANPGGFTGDACYKGGCGRPIHQNGCGGMNDRQVL